MAGTKFHYFYCQILFFVFLDPALVQDCPIPTAVWRVLGLASPPHSTPPHPLSFPTLACSTPSPDVSTKLQQATALHLRKRSQTHGFNDASKRLKNLSRAPTYFPTLFPASLFLYTLSFSLYNPSPREILIILQSLALMSPPLILEPFQTSHFCCYAPKALVHKTIPY